VEEQGEAPVSLRVVGMFDLHVDGRHVELPLQAQRLLAYLAVVRPVQPRSVLAGRLWGDTDERRATATLRNALWRLGKASRALVHASRGTVRLGPHVAVDLAQVRRWIAAIADDPSAGFDGRLIDALDADLLTGWDEEWLVIERERLRQMRVHALESLAEWFIGQGRHAEAIQTALAAMRAEPLRETAQLALIRAHLSEGNRSEAVRQFESFRRLLAEELGLRPSARIRTLLHEHCAA
jgi:DNA-binding SARP family transcriptional activator